MWSKRSFNNLSATGPSPSTMAKSSLSPSYQLLYLDYTRGKFGSIISTSSLEVFGACSLVLTMTVFPPASALMAGRRARTSWKLKAPIIRTTPSGSLYIKSSPSGCSGNWNNPNHSIHTLQPSVSKLSYYFSDNKGYNNFETLCTFFGRLSLPKFSSV